MSTPNRKRSADGTLVMSEERTVNLNDVFRGMSNVGKKVERMQRSMDDNHMETLELIRAMREEMRQQQPTRTANSSKLPPGLSAKVRQAHRNLGEDHQYNNERFNSPHNEAVTGVLMESVRDSGMELEDNVIRKACNRFFENLKTQAKHAQQGRTKEVGETKKRTSRRDRLFKNRLIVSKTLHPEDVTKYIQGAGPTFMSDEESEPEDKNVVVACPPRWRSRKLSQYLLECQQVLDENFLLRKAPSGQKRRKRVEGRHSSRNAPQGRAAAKYIEDEASGVDTRGAVAAGGVGIENEVNGVDTRDVVAAGGSGTGGGRGRGSVSEDNSDLIGAVGRGARKTDGRGGRRSGTSNNVISDDETSDSEASDSEASN
ncbi:uncharacterized protein LOC118404982 [Branchiostoma floridae]|uniref:Uncharacterized protein LOC118404982 n=1 Tax=Branchiostoma floridae TaxID=7739 RepID=A0A9J7KFD6_BRAFL|nr:uncharacterized protein LOC118404982 [Branchiostoma floridae]